MDAIDWQALGKLHERADSGPDMQDAVTHVRDGTVGELVRHVALLSAEHRSRMVLEVAGGRTLNVGEILELAAREDLGD